MTLEDARIVIQATSPWCSFDIVYRLQPGPAMDGFWQHKMGPLALDIMRYRTAVVTIQRHLPAPLLYHSFDYFVALGRAKLTSTYVPWSPRP